MFVSRCSSEKSETGVSVRRMDTFLDNKRLYTWMNENEEIYQVVGWISCLLPQHIAKLSTMTQDAIVYKVSSCFFFFVMVIFFCF